jgi:mRNA-degrading endonuclease RelE of RelBE toxin-antitoxin system
MNWDFLLASKAQRAFRALPVIDRQRINKALNEMKTDPLSGDIVALKEEYRGQFRRRVGSWRIIFEIDATARVVLIHDIARRTSTTY